MTLTAAGDLSDFDEARRTSVAAVVAAEVDKPLSAVSVTVVAASVRIDVRIAAGTNATSAAEMAGTLATSFESAAAATALLASAQVNVTLPPSVSTDQEVVVFAPPSAPPASGYVQVLHSVFELWRINACHTSVTVIVMELANATGVSANRILNTTVHRIASQQATGHACDQVRLFTLFTGGSDPTLDELKSMLVNNGLLGGSLHVVANRTTLETISIEELERLQREHAEERQKWEEASERNRQKERRHLLRWLGAIAGCLASVALVGVWGCCWLKRHFVRVRKQRKGHPSDLSLVPRRVGQGPRAQALLQAACQARRRLVRGTSRASSRASDGRMALPTASLARLSSCPCSPRPRSHPFRGSAPTRQTTTSSSSTEARSRCRAAA